MDGYAVRAVDTAGASESSPVPLAVIEDLPAGKSPGRPLKPGQAARIMTGAPLPRGADAVVMVEWTEQGPGPGRVRIMKAAGAGDNIAPAGEDVKKGEVVLPRGTRLGPAELGMAAALGRSRLKVFRRPRVAVISTGNEVQTPGRRLKPGMIYDANGYSLTALARRHGCEARFMGIARDREDELIKKLKQCPTADVVFLTGGVSVGDYDLALDALKAHGVRRVFYKVRIQPGLPTFCGKKNRQLFFGLPGNPVSAMVCFELFARPVLEKITGGSGAGMPRAKAVMAAEAKIRPGRRKFLRARIVGPGPELKVALFRTQKSGVLSSMMDCDVLVDVPGECALLKAGQEVEVLRVWEERTWRS